MSPIRKALILAGLALVVIGLAWPLLGRLGLFRLPGDIRIEREGFALYVPLTTMILLSVAASLILRWLGR